MARITRATVEQIKARADVLDVVSEVVTLKQRGQNWQGLCPFHDEKTPSFSVSPSKGIYHCFGCGKGGNAITFIMETEKLDYVEALKRLADRYNISITWEGGDTERLQDEVSLIYELHDKANDFYREQLFSEEGKQALDYLEKRGFSEQVLKKFSVGYASGKWDGLLKLINKNRYLPKVLRKSGLFIEKKNNADFFDRFRHRIMFPIHSLSGRVIGFGGRTLDPDEKAKYMNSPETPIYYKSEVLYGLYFSKDAIRKAKNVYIVEGYTDFLRIFSSGFENVAAGSGTALTQGHARILKRFVSKVTLCYDGDNAGKNAAEKAGFIFLKEGVDVNVISFPENDDPDSYLKTHTKEDFEKLSINADSFIDFYIKQNGKTLHSPGEKTRFVEEVALHLVDIQNPVSRNFIAKAISEKLNISEQVILNQVRRSYRNKKFQKDNRQIENTPQPRPVIESVIDKSEYELIRLMLLKNDELNEYVINLVEKQDFVHSALRNIAEKLFHFIMTKDNFELGDLFEEDLDENGKYYLSKIIMELDQLKKENDEDTLKKLASDCIYQLKISQIDRKIIELRDEIKKIDKQDGDSIELVMELAKLQKKKKNIKMDLNDF